jgi:hypothetical protein
MDAVIEQQERSEFPVFTSIGYITLICLLPIQLGFSYLFYKSSNSHPIMGIYPKLVTASNGMIAPLLFLWGISLILPVNAIPCFVVKLSTSALDFYMFVCIILEATTKCFSLLSSCIVVSVALLDHATSDASGLFDERFPRLALAVSVRNDAGPAVGRKNQNSAHEVCASTENSSQH